MSPGFQSICESSGLFGYSRHQGANVSRALLHLVGKLVTLVEIQRIQSSGREQLEVWSRSTGVQARGAKRWKPSLEESFLRGTLRNARLEAKY